MVKADSQSLIALNREITDRLDEFLLKMNEIYKLSDKLENTWDSDKFGSFMAVIETIKGSVFDIESGLLDARKGIAEMIQIIQKYESIRF